MASGKNKYLVHTGFLEVLFSLQNFQKSRPFSHPKNCVFTPRGVKKNSHRVNLFHTNKISFTPIIFCIHTYHFFFTPCKHFSHHQIFIHTVNIFYSHLPFFSDISQITIFVFTPHNVFWPICSLLSGFEECSTGRSRWRPCATTIHDRTTCPPRCDFALQWPSRAGARFGHLNSARAVLNSARAQGTVQSWW